MAEHVDLHCMCTTSDYVVMNVSMLCCRWKKCLSSAGIDTIQPEGLYRMCNIGVHDVSDAVVYQ